MTRDEFNEQRWLMVKAWIEKVLDHTLIPRHVQYRLDRNGNECDVWVGRGEFWTQAVTVRINDDMSNDYLASHALMAAQQVLGELLNQYVEEIALE